MKKELEQFMERASQNMKIRELLDDKSPDYIKGFFDGIRYEMNYIFETLSPKIQKIEDLLS